MSEAADTLRTVSDVLRLVGTAAPEPVGVAARVLSAAAGALSVLFDEGLDEAQAIAAIHRVTRIDTRAVDAAADARIAARREAERTERGDEITREIHEGHGGRSAIADATREPTREIPDMSLGPRPR